MSTLVRMRPMTDVALLVCQLVVVFAAAAIGGWLTMLGMPDWYDSLIKPSFNPPDTVFGPVWTVLYLSMAIAAWLALRSAPVERRPLVLGVFALQLALNVAWSGLFFAGKSPGWALVDIALLWAAILATILVFWRYHKLAGALLVPYLLWVSFAAVLNFSLWQLNSAG